MVLAVRPVILLVKLPVPVPSVDLLSVIVGVVPVLQQTPRAVTVKPPSEVMLPPLEAVVSPIPVTTVVVNSGTGKGSVVNDIALPYPVPALLVA